MQDEKHQSQNSYENERYETQARELTDSQKAAIEQSKAVYLDFDSVFEGSKLQGSYFVEFIISISETPSQKTLQATSNYLTIAELTEEFSIA